MGGFDAWRNFLLSLFPECFLGEFEDGKEFDISIVDLMEYLAPAIQSQKMGMSKTGFLKEYFDTGYVTRKVDEAVAYHINYDNNPKHPIITKACVFMLDTVHNVPRNKSSKQKARDQTDLPHMNEALFHKMQSLSTLKRPDNLFLFEDLGATQRYPLDGNTVWRSVNLKLQLYRLLTHHILHARIKPNTILLMDDGLAFSTNDYERVRKSVEYDLQIQGKGEFEKEFIINQIMTHSKDFITRFMVWEDAVFRRFHSTGIGEADIKILSYVKRGLGLKRFLVVNQDTDVIFILLLHMKSFLKGDASDDEYEVWIDTRSPNFAQSIKPYRFINVKRLYYAIEAFFTREFPLIKYPVETFCFIVFSQETDFTRKFSPSLQINPAFLWNCFAQLHTGKPDYIPFCEKACGGERRVKVSIGMKGKCGGLLNVAIQYDMVKRRYVLKHETIASFYYLLCQWKLLSLRKEIALSNGYYDYGEDSLVPVDELLIFGREVQEILDSYKQYDAENKAESEKFFLTQSTLKRPSPTPSPCEEEKRYKPSSSLTQPKRVIKISIFDDDQDEASPICPLQAKCNITNQMRNYLVRHAKKLQQLVKRESVNEYFGILTKNDMLCRIYRIEWYLSYCTDGWKTLLPCTERAKHDPTLSQWGWEERVVEGEEEFQRVMNSSYYHAQYDPQKPHLYQLSEVVECNRVSHKRLYF